jgi:hypothetical protein
MHAVTLTGLPPALGHAFLHASVVELLAVAVHRLAVDANWNKDLGAAGRAQLVDATANLLLKSLRDAERFVAARDMAVCGDDVCSRHVEACGSCAADCGPCTRLASLKQADDDYVYQVLDPNTGGASGERASSASPLEVLGAFGPGPFGAGQ